MSQVKFKYGTFEKLNSIDLDAGSIYVTIDSHSMFMDLPSTEKDENGEYIIKRHRIGDFETYENLKALVDDSKNWCKGSLALITNPENANGANIVPILAYYDGKTWNNINDTSALQTAFNEALSKLDDTVKSNTAAIEAIQNGIGQRPSAFEDNTIWEAISSLIGTSGDDLSLTALKQAIDENTTAIGQNTTAIGQNTTAIGQNTTAIGAEKTRAEGAEAALRADIDNLINKVDIENDTTVSAAIEAAKQDAINDATETAAADATSKAEAAQAAAIKTAKEYTDGEIDKIEAVGETLNQRIASIETDIETNYATKVYADNAADAAKQSAISAAAADATTKANDAQATANAHTDAEIKKVEGSISAVNETVKDLIGTDTDKTVREIAVEELSNQLLSGKADADFKTLQELGAWLEDHPESVAAINLAIQNLQKKTTLGTHSVIEDGNSVNKEYETVEDYVENVKSDLTDSINNLTASIEATDAKFNWEIF